MLDYSAITDERDADFAMRLVSEHGVAAIPISPFLQPGEAPGPVLRFCFAKRDETLERAAERLRRVYERCGQVGGVGRWGERSSSSRRPCSLRARRAGEAAPGSGSKFFEATRANLERSRPAGGLSPTVSAGVSSTPTRSAGWAAARGTEEFEVTPLPEGGLSRTLVARDGKPVRERRQTTRSRPRTRTSKRSPVADTAAALDLAIDHREQHATAAT